MREDFLQNYLLYQWINKAIFPIILGTILSIILGCIVKYYKKLENCCTQREFDLWILLNETKFGVVSNQSEDCF